MRMVFLTLIGDIVFFSLGGFRLQLGDFRPDGLPFGRSEDAVLKGFPKDGDLSLDIHNFFWLDFFGFKIFSFSA